MQRGLTFHSAKSTTRHSRTLSLIVLLTLAAFAPAATYTVTNNSNAGAGSLRDAIGQANANPGADTVGFDTAGVFSTSQTITLGGGQLVITGALTIDAPSAVAKRVTIDANNASRVMRVELTGSGTVTLRHLDLRDGNTTDDGGGIQMASAAGSTLELVDCVVRFCNARNGAGIDAQDSNLILTNTTVSGNAATRDGGGVITRGTVTMTGSSVSYNEAASDGGGLHADGATATITDTTIDGSDAARGAGIFAVGGSAIAMKRGSLSHNGATGDGGGLRAGGSSAVTFLAVDIDANDAANGGGISIRSATLEATNCLIVRNECTGNGGGIHFRSGTAVLKNCTLAQNAGPSDGHGIRTERSGMSVGNSVIAASAFGGNSTPDISGSFLSLGHNFISLAGTATGFTNGVDGDIVGTGASGLDPDIQFSTSVPEPRSRLVEAGDSALVTNPPYGALPFVDFKGNPRIRGVVDIGAIEAPFVVVVTNAADSGPGSLRDAPTSVPTDISFDPAFFGTTLRTITLTTGQITLNTDITLTAPGIGVIVSGTNSSRVFNITGGAVTLRRVRVIDGDSTSDGGGIRVVNNGTSLTLDESGVSNCTATGRGGGIFAEDTVTLSITNSTFSGNVAFDNGGGINLNAGATMNLTNSTVSTNTSRVNGGGIFVLGSTATIINCTVADNTADSDNAAPLGDGGGIRRAGGTVNVGNTIVARNTDSSTTTVHPDVSGVFTSLGNNLVGKTDGLDAGSGTPFQNGVNGDLAGTIASPLAAGLNALQQNPANSPARVHPLQAGSPARDAGSAALLTHAAWPSTPVAQDQRGQFRTVGTAVDIGAVEYPDTNLVKLTTEAGLTSEQTLQAVTFRIRRSYDDAAALVVNLSIDASSTASAADYTLSGASYTVTGPTTFTITIPAGKTSVLLTMTPLQDATPEGTEILALILAAGAGYSLDSAGVNTQSVLIYDNEITVTSTANAGPGTLREAVANANIAEGGVITMPSNANVTLGGGQLSIESDIQIFGNRSIVNAGGLSRVLKVANGGTNPVILRDLIITGGSTTESAGGGGVLLDVGSRLEMSGCVVTGNSATSGGGISLIDSSTFTLTSSAIVDNVATGEGGGLFAERADFGMENVTIAGNQARRGGGGISCFNSDGDFVNCTITENLADSDNSAFPGDDGGGLNNDTGSFLGCYNTVIAGNWDTPGNAGFGTINPDVSGVGSFAAKVRCFIGNNAGATAAFPSGLPNAAGNYVGSSASPLDAGLSRVTRPTNIYYEFAYGSLLFDRGANAASFAALDQRGLARIYNGTVDIGAVEMDFLLVSNASAQNAGSLRTALANAGAQGNGTIVFDPAFFNVPRTIALGTTGELPINSSCIISAPADPAAQLTVSGSNASRVFNVSPAAPAAVEFRNLDIINGSTAGNAAGNRFGAGMSIGANASLLMSGCEVRNCDALTAGGAVNIAAGGSLTASDCTFSANHATTQGGAVLNLGTVTLSRVLLRDNNADAEGAGLANAKGGTLTNCTFSNNRANSHGGAIFNLAAVTDVLSLTHCTLTLNRSNQDSSGGGNGGGIRRVSGIVNVRNTIISGNDALVSPQDDISGDFTSLGNNLVGTISGGTGFTNGLNGDLVGANAWLGPLQNNGGPTFTHALLAGSAALDTAANIAGITDQRGVLRPSALDDIGAYELLAESYAYWAAHTFPTATNAGMTQDYDGDGRSDGLEFGAGSDPLNAQSVPGVLTTFSGGNYVADFTASPLAPAGFTVLRYSTDLAIWQNVLGGLYQITGTDPLRNTVLYRVSIPVSFGPKLFLRLQRLP